MDNGIKIVTDKKISHFFTDATLEYKNTILGKNLKYINWYIFNY